MPIDPKDLSFVAEIPTTLWQALAACEGYGIRPNGHGQLVHTITKQLRSREACPPSNQEELVNLTPFDSTPLDALLQRRQTAVPLDRRLVLDQ